jgi:protein phosphatase 1 regulatory subunit 7
MSGSDAAPLTSNDPAITNDTANDQSHDAEQAEKHYALNMERKPRDSKGWDGKLRVEKKVVVDGIDQDADPQSDAEESEDDGPPPEQLEADEDLLDDVPVDEEEIDLVHCKISSIPALGLERFTKLKVSRCLLILLLIVR